MKNRPMELLSPAGGFEALKAAVLNGADAVYLGGGKFNARVNAGNFIGDELSRALDYAHERGVRVYITLNTLLKNSELKEALDFAAFSYQEGADAFIVQDLGLVKLLNQYLPELPLHASTQMTVTNTPSVQMLEKMGIKRVVLARELSLPEIKKIAGVCNAELEVFVHGAICVCYSGQCLMSSFIGARSGNRGLCAQPCRLPWSLSRDGTSFGKEAYLISPRDLMAVELLPELKKSGVASLKLEGRMKSPEYVGIVTGIYRKYLDLLDSVGESRYKVEEDDIERLKQAFNRGGFTQSYLKGDRNFTKLVYTRHPKNQGIPIGTVVDSRPPYVRLGLEKSLHMGDGLEIMDDDKGTQSLIVTAILQNDEHVRFADAGSMPWVGDIKTVIKKGSRVFRTLSKPLFEEARKTFERGESPLVPLTMRLTMRTGERPVLTAIDDLGNRVTVESDSIAEKAINRPLSHERAEEQLKKTGDTPYYIYSLETELDGQSVIPVSALNRMRREVLEEISRLRKIKRHPLNFNIMKESLPKNSQKSLALSLYFYEPPDNLDGLNSVVKRVYLPVCGQDLLVRFREQYNGEIFLHTPAIMKDNELNNIILEIQKAAHEIDGITYGSLGACQCIKEKFPALSLCADLPMNLFNNASLKLQRELGAKTGVLSAELRLNEVEDFSWADIEAEAIVYGRIPLMTMEHCPSAAETGCSQICRSCPKSRGYLKDRKGEVFPFIRDTFLSRTRIFNCHPMIMDDISVLRDTGLNLLRLCFTDEDNSTRTAVIKHYHERLTGALPDEENLRTIREIKDRGFTKGHWFRGV